MAFTYTGEGVQETPQYKIPPVAEYTVEVINGEEKISKSGKKMLVLTLKIKHPEYKNQLFDYIVDNEYTQQKFFNIMQSCGITPAKGMSVNAQTFIGRTATIKIKHDEYNGDISLKVDKWVKATPQTVVDPAFAPAPAAAHNANEIPF